MSASRWRERGSFYAHDTEEEDDSDSEEEDKEEDKDEVKERSADLLLPQPVAISTESINIANRLAPLPPILNSVREIDTNNLTKGGKTGCRNTEMMEYLRNRSNGAVDETYTDMEAETIPRVGLADELGGTSSPTVRLSGTGRVVAALHRARLQHTLQMDTARTYENRPSTTNVIPPNKGNVDKSMDSKHDDVKDDYIDVDTRSLRDLSSVYHHPANSNDDSMYTIPIPGVDPTLSLLNPQTSLLGLSSFNSLSTSSTSLGFESTADPASSSSSAFHVMETYLNHSHNNDQDRNDNCDGKKQGCKDSDAISAMLEALNEGPLPVPADETNGSLATIHSIATPDVGSRRHIADISMDVSHTYDDGEDIESLMREAVDFLSKGSGGDNGSSNQLVNRISNGTISDESPRLGVLDNDLLNGDEEGIDALMQQLTLDNGLENVLKTKGMGSLLQTEGKMKGRRKGGKSQDDSCVNDNDNDAANDFDDNEEDEDEGEDDDDDDEEEEVIGADDVAGRMRRALAEIDASSKGNKKRMETRVKGSTKSYIASNKECKGHGVIDVDVKEGRRIQEHIHQEEVNTYLSRGKGNNAADSKYEAHGIDDDNDGVVGVCSREVQVISNEENAFDNDWFWGESTQYPIPQTTSRKDNGTNGLNSGNNNISSNDICHQNDSTATTASSPRTISTTTTTTSSRTRGFAATAITTGIPHEHTPNLKALMGMSTSGNIEGSSISYVHTKVDAFVMQTVTSTKTTTSHSIINTNDPTPSPATSITTSPTYNSSMPGNKTVMVSSGCGGDNDDDPNVGIEYIDIQPPIVYNNLGTGRGEKGGKNLPNEANEENDGMSECIMSSGFGSIEGTGDDTSKGEPSLFELAFGRPIDKENIAVTVELEEDRAGRKAGIEVDSNEDGKWTSYIVGEEDIKENDDPRRRTCTYLLSDPQKVVEGSIWDRMAKGEYKPIEENEEAGQKDESIASASSGTGDKEKSQEDEDDVTLIQHPTDVVPGSFWDRMARGEDVFANNTDENSLSQTT